MVSAHTFSGASSAGGGAASSRASPAMHPLATSSKPKTTPVASNGYHPANQLPLSSMSGIPLDMSSVERRGQPTAIKEPVKKASRPFGLEEAPVYQPTEEEWKDPMAYMRKITPEAKQYGLCKIIPPESWNPDFAIDTEKFHFRTRKQDLNSVEGSSRANITYVDALLKFHKQNGNNLNRMPFVDKRPLDLYRLKKAVEAREGFDKVCKLKKWAEIGRDLGYSGKIMSSLSTSLKNSYQKWLCPYEDYLRRAKPGVHQQLEWENGGPLTPSPAPSPMKRSTVNTPSSLRGESPARQATDSLLQATMNGLTNVHGSERNTPAIEAPSLLAQPPTSGFTPINFGGGFTAVNAGLISGNRPVAADVKNFTPPKQFASPMSSAKNTPEYRPSGLGPVNALKRQLSCDSLDSAKDNGTDKDDENGSRRSKRLKKDTVPTVAGSHMSMFRPTLPRIPRDERSTPGEKCEHCGKGGEAGFLAVCESCDHTYHGSCLDPPLKNKPDSEWNCPRCLVGDGQFGFEEGGLYSLRQFQEKAADFKQAYFEKKMPHDPVLGCARPVTEEDVENEFWRLVADVDEEVQVEYGADIHCTTHGSGFPTVERHPNNPYSTDPWNLNILPLHSESLFRHIKTDISGMTVPWVYVGMIFSTFCWHNEDHYAYSANYQHFGATKTWYGIPAEDAEKFENAMKEAIPELFETQPDLLFQLVTLLTPDQLKKAGVRVYAVDQRAGQFVITFPQAYHAGFNHGFNFNEAVNFAPCDWEPWGLDGVQRMQAYRRQPCFSHDELLWTAADGVTSGGLTIPTAKWLAPALDRIHDREMTQRKEFIQKHLSASPHRCSLGGEGDDSCDLTFKIEDVDVAEEEYGCSYCRAYAYLSRFKCLKSGKIYCLMHAGSQSCCSMPEEKRMLGQDHVLYFRKADDVLGATCKRVTDKANVPEAWEDKYDKALEEEAAPSLKTLRNLLNEGERIPYELKSLPLLRAFVERCNHWVEEATNYTVRKQQNRRKNEKVWQSGMRKSIGNAYQDEKEREMRNVNNIYRLLDEAEKLGFDSPEIQQLKDRADAIKVFQDNAKNIIEHPSMQRLETVEELLEDGHGFNVDLDETEKLSRVLDKLKWNQKAKANRGVLMSYQDVTDLIEEAKRIGIEPYNDHFTYYGEQLHQGRLWESKAQEVIGAEVTHYPQLEALSNQATLHALPVSQDTLAKVEQILHKQREAHRQIVDLNTRSRSQDYRKRPKYTEVADIMKKIEELQSKPTGTLDLEKEQKRHEDWMRRGKKLFGKTNAPLHILKSHMDYVLDRNQDCFNFTEDKPRLPAEPASREPSPETGSNKGGVHRWEDPRFREVFCICRRIEAGMMIECELCHEWYHGRCLKIARGKVKEDDKYTCPICDWRVKIPRDAARPNLEDLVAWYEEIPNLPFQPDEEEVLKKIIDNAQDFRNHIASYTNPILSTADQAETQRFYLRKIEGSEVLLSFETNFFRQELHKWSPVAPMAPPVIEASKSTRKPRPTKLEKLLSEHGVGDADELPDHVKSKGLSLKRKRLNAEMAAAAAAAASTTAPNQLSTSPSIHGYPSYYPRGTSSQPQTPGLSVASSSHAHPSRGPDSSSSSSHSGGGPMLKAETIDTDSNPNIHPNFFLHNNNAQNSGRQEIIPQSEIMTQAGKSPEQAEAMFSRNMFGGEGISGSSAQHTNEAEYAEGNMKSMFDELINQDDERDITAASLENERNGIEAMLDGE